MIIHGTEAKFLFFDIEQKKKKKKKFTIWTEAYLLSCCLAFRFWVIKIKKKEIPLNILKLFMDVNLLFAAENE